jgi:hypothetical protein
MHILALAVKARSEQLPDQSFFLVPQGHQVLKVIQKRLDLRVFVVIHRDQKVQEMLTIEG